ncbi:MAG: cation transporter [Collinsella sp.]|nr:cation transporter [Collinsella sp.]
MRKVFKLDEIDCAVCAGKLEEAIKKVDGVQSAKINFLTQKLALEADDDNFDAVLDAVVKLTAEIEPDCEILR